MREYTERVGLLERKLKLQLTYSYQRIFTEDIGFCIVTPTRNNHNFLTFFVLFCFVNMCSDQLLEHSFVHLLIVILHDHC